MDNLSHPPAGGMDYPCPPTVTPATGDVEVATLGEMTREAAELPSEGTSREGRCDKTRQEAVDALRGLAYGEAARVGLGEDDAQDCAMDLVLHALQQDTEPSHTGHTGTVFPGHTGTALPAVAAPLPNAVIVTRLVLRSDLPPEEITRWLRRCARNFALNYRRRRAGREGQETCWSSLPAPHPAASQNEAERVSREERASNPARPDSHNYHTYHSAWATPCDTLLLRQEFRQALYAAVAHLPPVPRDLFTRFHLDEDELLEVVYSSGKSVEAVRQSLLRSRQQVRHTLQRHGVSEADYPQR